MLLRRLLLIALGSLAFSACDVVEPDPLPVEPPPAVPVHPYGVGNGKVIFVSDLAVAERIDVTLGGESVGAITKFVGCPGRVTADDSLAVAVRPAGNYQYTARSTTGITWATSSVQINEDGLKQITFIGRPSQYAGHLPSAIEGISVARGSEDQFHVTRSAAALELRVTQPTVIEGDRMDVVVNGVVVARGVALATEVFSFPIELNPGPNYVAVRLSTDVGTSGALTRAALYANGTQIATLNDPVYGYPGPLVSRAWSGMNVRYSC